jgi:hypothetical protein
MNCPLVIADLPLDQTNTLTQAQMQRIVGGRDKIVGTVNGGPATTTLDTFDLNNAIWEGRIGGPMIV